MRVVFFFFFKQKTAYEIVGSVGTKRALGAVERLEDLRQERFLPEARGGHLLAGGGPGKPPQRSPQGLAQRLGAPGANRDGRDLSEELRPGDLEGRKNRDFRSGGPRRDPATVPRRARSLHEVGL